MKETKSKVGQISCNGGNIIHKTVNQWIHTEKVGVGSVRHGGDGW